MDSVRSGNLDRFRELHADNQRQYLGDKTGDNMKKEAMRQVGR
jgi:hypothetical protein